MDMQFANATAVMLFINLGYALVALVLGVAGIKLVDRLFLRKLDLEDEIQKGNIAAAIFASTLILFVAIIIGMALAK